MHHGLMDSHLPAKIPEIPECSGSSIDGNVRLELHLLRADLNAAVGAIALQGAAIQAQATQFQVLCSKIGTYIELQGQTVTIKALYAVMAAMFLGFAGGIGVKALAKLLGVDIPI